MTRRLIHPAAFIVFIAALMIALAAPAFGLLTVSGVAALVAAAAWLVGYLTAGVEACSAKRTAS